MPNGFTYEGDWSEGKITGSGTATYATYGDEFPLLIKFIDAAEDLSIQVHPDDTLAASRHNGKGKTEMWYIMDADPGATLIAGFNQPMNREKYLEYFTNRNLEDVLNREEVTAGDVFYIPAGRIHTIGKGIMLAEIQQTSDITYRIYDFDRRDAEGNLRELHTELAIDALDFEHYPEYKTPYAEKPDHRNPVVNARYFTTNKLLLEKPMTLHLDGEKLKILICVGGNGRIQWSEGETEIATGDVYLIPASLPQVSLVPDDRLEVLEVMP